MLPALKKELTDNIDKRQAENLQRFFKTGKGEYGEGDIFLGVRVPVMKNIAKKYINLGFSDIQELLKSKYHEERMVALSILVHRSNRGDEKERKKIYDLYLKNTKYINNWDLVDLSSYKIVGAYLDGKDKSILEKLAKSKSIWEKRIAMISTFYFINKESSKEAIKIAEMLVYEKHDLIQKAVGWMLREVGKRCNQETEEKFLMKYYKTMPRTMLRYSIERFSEEKRKFYMNKS
jgi:3-methyladenine DNA glycosylase AlkD